MICNIGLACDECLSVGFCSFWRRINETSVCLESGKLLPGEYIDSYQQGSICPKEDNSSTVEYQSNIGWIITVCKSNYIPNRHTNYLFVFMQVC